MKKKFSIVPIMKKIAPVLILSIFLLPLTARAEIKAGSVELTPFAGYNFFEKRQNLVNRPVYGGRIGYNFTENFGIEAAGEFMQTRVDDKSTPFDREGKFTAPIDSVKIYMYHLDLVYHFMSDGNFNPFISAGYGAANYNPKINSRNMSIIDFGVGAKYWLGDNVALRLDLRDNMVYDDQINNLQATLGIVFAFGGEKKVVSAVRSASSASEVADTTPPRVLFTTPANRDSNVYVNQKINIGFSEDMDLGTVNADTVIVKQGSTTVAGTVLPTASTATFTPSSNLEKGKTYTATVTTGVKDPAGNKMASNYEWGFTTGQAADITPPTVSFTSPADGDKTAPVRQNVSVAFSEAMDPATLNSDTFVVMQEKNIVSGKVTSAASNATFTTTRDFEKGKPYTATVTTGAKDLAGNPLARNYVWHFTAYSAPKVVALLATLQNSHFEFNSSAISEDGKTILYNNIKALKADPKMKLHVSGYTSASGTVEYNQKLSERRAAAVKDYLVKVGGIDGSRITTVGYGEAHPARYEADPSNKLSPAALANMRVIVEIIE